MKFDPEISIIIPCLNEEKSIGFCLEEVIGAVSKNNLSAEIIVVDNNSTDNTAQVVKSFQSSAKNIILINENRVGYGSAYLAGINNAKGEYIFMADGDGSYDFSQISDFIKKLKDGSDLVVGNRLNYKEIKHSMPFIHRVIGNPFLSALVRFLFKVNVRDVHCGVRAIKMSAISKIKLNTVGMEFASEMIIKSAKENLNVSEIDVIYRRRIGESKLRTFYDGCRHLRLIFLSLI